MYINNCCSWGGYQLVIQAEIEEIGRWICVKVVDWSLIMVSQWHAYHEFVKNKMQRQLLKKEAVKVVI